MFSLISSMGWYWLAVPLAATVLGLLAVFTGIARVLSGEVGNGAGRLVIGSPLAILGVAGSLIAFNTQTFVRLTHEAPVAQVGVKAVDPSQQIYAVTVQRLDGPKQSYTCNIQGQEWMLSARVQKWKPWANVLGLNTTYDLDQLSNKYADAATANGKTITACSLAGPEPTVNQFVPQSWLFWLLDRSYVQDRAFGSAVYMPLKDGAVYRVVITQSALNAEPANGAAASAPAE